MGADSIRQLPDEIRIDYLQAFGGAIHSVYQIAAGVMVIAFLLALFIKDQPLRRE